MQEHEVADENQDEKRYLGRDNAAEISLSKVKKRRRESSVVDGSLGNSFGYSPEH